MVQRHPLPEQCFSLVAENRDSVLLHTSKCDDINSRSFLFLNPIRVLVARRTSEVHGLLDAIVDATRSGYFAAGYLSYECGGAFEPHSNPSNECDGCLAWFGVFKEPFVFNHLTGGFDGPDGLSPHRRERKLPGEFAITNLKLGISESDYIAKVNEIHDLIRAGDTYQINFTDRFTFDFGGDPAALFSALTRAQPVSYSAFIHHDDRYLLSLSPELFFRARNGRIATRPMKGTAPRGRTVQEDEQIADWLWNDAKNRAENVMIVDMLRNDIGRICEYGSVHVDDLFSIEKYATLFQMTSTVSGKLQPEIGLSDILAAMFPSGSVTGAPKIRSMQIISQIEQRSRGVYTGSIGFSSPGGESTYNVAIRTILLQNGRGEMGVGGGITTDSKPDDELRECQLKARFLREKFPQFAIFESLLWDGSFPFLHAHLSRMENSALYFDFPFDSTEAERLLLEYADSLHPGSSSKVRLELSSSGKLLVSSITIGAHAGSGVVTISDQRTSSNDRFLFHKTTNRRLYTEAYERAVREGFEDILFLNERDELTEGAISNVVLQFGETLYTPPLSCGLLPGVYRQHLIATNPAISERVLTLEDLSRADAVFLCNAVRGLRRVRIGMAGMNMVGTGGGIEPSTC